MQGEVPYIDDHTAVRLNHFIMVLGGSTRTNIHPFQDNSYTVWLYNIFLEEWKKYQIPKNKRVPKLDRSCGIVIREDVIIFGGKGVLTNIISNELWKLTWNTNDSFEWNRILVKHQTKTPSPRTEHSGWEYDGKLWTFGGFGPSINDYLNEHGNMQTYSMDDGNYVNNQLFHFNPVSNEWTNLQCFGTVPSPRERHATTVRGGKLWLYGGDNVDKYFDELYELGMCFLTWTNIQTVMPKPPRLSACSLNVTRENLLVLHCGEKDDGGEIFKVSWILDLSSYSWKKCTYDDCLRWQHTGSLGISNNIIIIGGFYGGFFNREADLDQCTPVCHVMLEPKSLQQLSIKTVHKYRGQLPWKYLPQKLIKLMQYGGKDDTTDAQDSPAEAD